MNIQYNELPFPHIIVKNFYDESELKLIWRELEFLTSREKMLSPTETGSAVDKQNNPTKENKGLFLDEVYKKREVSDILGLVRKIYHLSEIYDRSNIIFKYIGASSRDLTLLSYYENGAYYKPHRDDAVITSLMHFYREPKKFSGGDLYFPEYDYEIECLNNRLLLIPSIVQHEVKTIEMDETEVFSTNGRYTLSTFMYMGHRK